MGKRDKRFDVYIADAPEFAQPILTHIRELVHSACPDVEEAIKWSHPHFVYKGMLCMMATFKQHCAFGFWKGALIVDPETKQNAEGAHGQFGRITSVKQLPSKKVLTSYIKQAMDRNRKALNTFDAFSPSQRKEYIEWITDAKSEDTRNRRLEQAVEWMAEGKQRHWKYQK